MFFLLIQNSLFHRCDRTAISAIQSDKELKAYYSKRVEEGKPKMVVINIIRNKIVSRVFATVKRGTPIVEMNKYAA